LAKKKRRPQERLPLEKEKSPITEKDKGEKKRARWEKRFHTKDKLATTSEGKKGGGGP